MTTTDKAARIEALRQRYLELKAAGDDLAPKALPPLTARDGAPLTSNLVRQREEIPGGWYWTARLARGERLRLVNTQATPGVAVFLWNAADTSERYNSADTMKLQWTAALPRGRVLFSDMGRVLASVVEDTVGAHDSVVGGSTPASNLRRYGDAALRNTQENMRLAASKFGLGKRDLAPVISFFSPVYVKEDGSFGWRDDVLAAGDFVELRAEMDLLVAISNCPHPFSPGAYAPQAIEAVIWQGPSPAGDDICRTATAEAVRGFENTDPLFAGR
ncbi:urea amidolyase associated protein UAAP1 [Zavarzinia compransoris]|uniref:Urea carboxylase n=1 Tax=Zavarzinia compransoris TaxID=1264899 RepID=A0A317E5B3_9PROT|nr:urea amidolyase associated protein UAAP1 [Zavarzinia compransoris]PWR21861.1 urea carboxylase [Zavarzinia compransoris]TDP45334.1 hypothetical protein DES42_10534 [Zavarzinia compransoris]